MLDVKKLLGRSASLIYYAEPDTDCRQLSEIMANKSISFLPVVEQNGSLLGVVSSHDVLRCEMEGNVHAKAGDICSRDIISIESKCSARDAAQLMINHGVHHLIVSDDQEIRGVISSLDLLNLSASE